VLRRPEWLRRSAIKPARLECTTGFAWLPVDGGTGIVIIGLWLGIVGYGVLYAGVLKLGGSSCSLGQAFRGGCVPAAHTNAATSGSGTTLLGQQQATLAQQQGAVPSVPVRGLQVA
jgi:hypothetical protein